MGISSFPQLLRYEPDGLTLEVINDILSIKDLGVSTAKLAALAVTEGKIAAAAVTRGKIALPFDRRIRTAGSIVINNVNWTSFGSIWDSGAESLSIAASAGEVIMVGAAGHWDASGVYSMLDVVSMVSGSPVNWISRTSTFGSGSGTGSLGVSGWAGQNNVAAENPFIGELPYVVQAGDISGGAVELRLYYRTFIATNKTLLAEARRPLHFWARNIGTTV